MAFTKACGHMQNQPISQAPREKEGTPLRTLASRAESVSLARRRYASNWIGMRSLYTGNSCRADMHWNYRAVRIPASGFAAVLWRFRRGSDMRTCTVLKPMACRISFLVENMRSACTRPTLIVK